MTPQRDHEFLCFEFAFAAVCNGHTHCAVDCSKEKQAFYKYHACMMEPWDGSTPLGKVLSQPFPESNSQGSFGPRPALVAFTDGLQFGATLDRNGLRRPLRRVLPQRCTGDSALSLSDGPGQGVTTSQRTGTACLTGPSSARPSSAHPAVRVIGRVSAVMLGHSNVDLAHRCPTFCPSSTPGGQDNRLVLGSEARPQEQEAQSSCGCASSPNGLH